MDCDEKQTPEKGEGMFGRCVRLADLNSDGDWKLLIADFAKKLKVCVVVADRHLRLCELIVSVRAGDNTTGSEGHLRAL